MNATTNLNLFVPQLENAAHAVDALIIKIHTQTSRWMIFKPCNTARPLNIGLLTVRGELAADPFTAKRHGK